MSVYEYKYPDKVKPELSVKNIIPPPQGWYPEVVELEKKVKDLQQKANDLEKELQRVKESCSDGRSQ